MDKLLLGLSLLCLTWTISGRICIKCRKRPQLKDAKSLKCRTCSRSLENGECIDGFGTCIATKHETCLTEKFYLGGVIQFARLMCKKHCKSRTTIRHHKTWVYECCWSQNFCNSFSSPDFPRQNFSRTTTSS